MRPSSPHFVSSLTIAARPAPSAQAGFGKRLQEAFFPTFWSGLATIALSAMLLWLGFRFFGWALPGAVFIPDAAACRALDFQHACWGFIAEKYRLILFGRYPYDEQWRPLIALLVVGGTLVVTALPRFWSRYLLWLWFVALAIFFVLMTGGGPFATIGLSRVDTVQWGGLPLTVLLTLVSMVASIPIGVLLALGRRSTLPVVRTVCTSYIELVRGVPLITVLFMASFVLPLFFPQGVRSDALTRILIGLTLFQAAYLAETLRGGLQAIPRGQYEAAQSLGLGYWRTQALVILPQAFVHVIPALVNNLLSMLMDTSLVTVVSMYDLTGALRLALGDALWRNFFIEGYLFIALIYFAACFTLSRYSRWLERRMQQTSD
ncbi:MAG: amino acid ABC transporter permease [Proteobacteria bacterium]|nr:amino acid ABC transporter permease [Pseudomonadota bacterium]